MGSGRGRSKRARVSQEPSSFPLRRLDSVWHIGTLDPADLHSNYSSSYEGHGLSVSLDPEEWERIANLGGRPCHELNKEGARFIDAHSLTTAQKNTVKEWGVTQKYVTPQNLWRLYYYDSEEEQDRWLVFDNEDAARNEASTMEEEKIKMVIGLKPTEKFIARTNNDPGLECFDELLVLYADEKLPEIDGVWWEDDYGDLSAPRGCILPSRLGVWQRVSAVERALV
jgi:hypothetical protein